MGWGTYVFFILLGWITHHAEAHPIPDGTGREDGWGEKEYIGAALAVAALLSSVTTLLACVCCKGSGFKELDSVSSRVAGSTSTINNVGGTGGGGVGGGNGRGEEFTMFPPPGISQLSLSTTHINFEPLPDIRPRSGSRRDQRITDKTLPASFPNQVSSGLPTDEWFAEPHQNFPRNQLQYVKEIGKGWFGHVLEGRATGIFSDHTKGDSPVTSSVSPSASSSRGQTPVAVKVLREDATPTEQMYFLHELRPYRDLTHPNVLKVLAQCLETEPFLILMQLCPKGDLKAVVRNDKKLTDATLLHMMFDVASGLQHMHNNSFIHTDLAARNCVVDEDYTVKIGDYGYNIDFYKAEYYCAGEVALPLRWCSPETLKCTDTTIETKEVTKAANVWSYGVIMWEIASRGLMPYTHLDDDRVIQEVVIDQSTIPEPPKGIDLHAEKIYNIMKLCWCPDPSRPPIDHITALLSHLWENHSVASQDTSSLNDFELRWNQLQQHQSQDHSIIHTLNTSDLRFESDFSLAVPGSSPMGGALSPSLQNLHGSVEDLDAKMAAKFGSAMPSWLGIEPGQPMDSLTREITDAILKLDDYLAGEKSEPSSVQASPDKDGINFKLGKDSFVSYPPESKLVHAGGLSMSGSGHPSLTRTLSEGDEEGFTMRLEQGDFSEMVRLKSQSVQDFMRLTVVDDGSDSDNASQRNSLAFEQVNKPLATDKTYSSEGNISEALRDVRFMGDLERLQAEHKYSIITEASRENPSSIEFRAQDYSFDKPIDTDDIADSEAGSTEKLTSSIDSDNSNNFNDKQNGELDPFLGEVISSECAEERTSNVYPIPKKESDFSNNSVNSSSLSKTLSSSPDFVVSSREKKPVSLPDIVVHDAAIKVSTPSPPPETSPLKVVNATQPKEFRVVFSDMNSNDSNVKKENESERVVDGDTILFSENIKGIKLQNSVENNILSQRNDDAEVKSACEEGLGSGVRKEEPSCKKEEIIKFLDFVHENPKCQLTSTPLKSDSVEDSPHIVETYDEKTSEESSCNSGESSLENPDYEDVEYNTGVGVLGVDPDNSGVKQRLVFGYHSEKSYENSSRSSNSSSGESSDEEDSDTNILERENLETPSYKPEQIVKGEEVVIGALEDYSLDLFKVVKSTAAPSCDKSSSATVEIDLMPESSQTEKVNNKADELEYDLQKWDEFLGNKLNEEKHESDVTFRDSPHGRMDIGICDNSKDILGGTFDAAHSSSKSNEPDGQVHAVASEKSALDLSTTFEHSTCDEIQEIFLKNDESRESPTDASRPKVNTDLFFNSNSSSSKSLIEEIAKESSKTDTTKVNSSNISSYLEDPGSTQSQFSDESFFTAESASATVDLLPSAETSGMYHTPSNRLIESSEPSGKITVIEDPEKNANTSCEFNSSTDCSTAKAEESSSIQTLDVSSDSFTYRKEGSLDNICDMGDVCSSSPTSHSTCSVTESHGHFGTKNELLTSASGLSSTKKLMVNIHKDDTLSDFSQEKNEVHSKSRTTANELLCQDDEKVVETTKSHRTLNLENIASRPSNGSTSLTLKKFGPDTQVNMIIGDDDDDDLSPSAYQGKLKSEDCWSSQEESQDSAVENDETENGDFWQQQMVAWQQAAFQTRQLLQQATHSGSDAALSSLKGSREDLEASPRSDTSSTKSPYSSTDMLNLDDEGTYVSYNTTDDEEVLGYKPEDISALRAELNLKLGGLQDERTHMEPEESDDPSSNDRDNVVINYRGMVTTTLSPIKEESFLDEDESPFKKYINRPDSINKFDLAESDDFEESLKNSSVDCVDMGDGTFVVNEAVNDVVVREKIVSLSEFASAEALELLENNEEKDDTSSKFVIGQETLTTSDVNLDSKQENTSLENTHNSLILEDLEEEDGPPSIQIYDSKDNLDADDVLVVDTQTNEATIVDGGIPRSHLAFIVDEEQPDPTDVQPFSYDESDDVAPESIPSVGGSRYDEMRHREQFLTNNPSWESQQITTTGSQGEYEGDSESKPEDALVNGLVTSEDKLDRRKGPEADSTFESPQGIQVPHYHSYFTSALSTIAHPSASLEEPPMFEPVEHISLPYDVNYPTAGEHLQSLDDVSEKEEDENKTKSPVTTEVDDEDESEPDPPIKLNFLGRLYSDDSEEVNEYYPKSRNAGEATLLSDSDEEAGASHEAVTSPKTSNREDNLSSMTSAEFLASEKYKINDNEDIEEHIEVEPGLEVDSDDDDGVALTPGKLSNVKFRMSTQDPRYTPDWESDSDSDGESSSTSGEFMWKPGEECQQSNYILDVIEEEGEDEGRHGDVDEDGCSDDSESGEEEFTPSKWNRDLTPSHSLLKSPQNKSSLKKSVRWKRQRHHRVYEYPPEPRSWEPTPTESQRRAWGRSSLDYLSLADWDLGDEFIADDSGDMDDYVYNKPTRPAPPPPIYSLGSIAYDDVAEGYLEENGEFFIRPSGSPFTFTSSSFSASDFYPGSTFYSGQDHRTDLSESIADKLSKDFSEHLLPDTLQSGHSRANVPMTNYVVTDDMEQSSPTNTGLGQLRHTRDKLRLEIPTISVASDGSKGAVGFTLNNEQSEFENYNGQGISSTVSLSRSEPEVSEV